MRYRATLAYDGTAYHGFQRQAGHIPTIQLAVEAAIEAVTAQRVVVLGAGRTDAGVHATGQVIAFDVEWPHSAEALLRALNAALPPDIALQDIRQQPGFHPRYDALSRRYRYRVIDASQRQPLIRLRAWHVWGGLDGDAMRAAAALLVGRHDFAAFGRPPHGENTVRTVILSEWASHPQPAGTLWTYTIEADAFLQHMVRRIAYMLVRVGQGKITRDAFEAEFRRARLPDSAPTAPAHGLTLEAVRYPDSPQERLTVWDQAGEETPAGG